MLSDNIYLVTYFSILRSTVNQQNNYFIPICYIYIYTFIYLAVKYKRCSHMLYDYTRYYPHIIIMMQTRLCRNQAGRHLILLFRAKMSYRTYILRGGYPHRLFSSLDLCRPPPGFVFVLFSKFFHHVFFSPGVLASSSSEPLRVVHAHLLTLLVFPGDLLPSFPDPPPLPN
jgi:hypothetical protein